MAHIIRLTKRGQSNKLENQKISFSSIYILINTVSKKECKRVPSYAIRHLIQSLKKKGGHAGKEQSKESTEKF